MLDQPPGRFDIAELRAAAAAEPKGSRVSAGRRNGLLGLGVVLATAVVAGLAWSASSQPDGAARVADPIVELHQDRVAWAPVLRQLDVRRSQAFATGDGAGLIDVYAPDSPALAQELERLAALAGAGVTARGLRIDIVDVRVAGTSPGRVDLLVRDRLPAYDLVSDLGRVIERRPGRGDREWLVTVVPATGSTGEWRIDMISPAPR